MNPSRLLLLTAAAALPLQAQGVALHLDAGLASSLDKKWKAERDTTGSAGVVTKFPLALEGALVFPVGPGAIRTAVRFAVDEPFSNSQLGADWIQVFSRKTAETAYISLGVTMNNVKSRIEVVPPAYPAPGVYEQRSQSGRPGYRFGLGYAFSRSFAFECAVNSVNLESSGANGFLHSSTSYATLTCSYRIHKLFGAK